MMKKILVTFLITFLLGIFLVSPGFAKVFNYRNISVYYNDVEDLKQIMSAVDITMFWFQAVSKQAGIPISYEKLVNSYLNIVVTEIKKPGKFGYFDKRFIFIRSKKDDMKYFGLSIKDDPDLYMSAVAHEITHALLYQYADGYGFDIKTNPGSEYAAYVCMFAMSEKSFRKRILENYKSVEPFDHRMQINYFLYSANPEFFGVMSWLHYLNDRKANKDNPSEIILHKIFKGEFESISLQM